jgi:anti-sigma factor RsiW
MRPGAVTREEILAYVDGDAPEHVAEHVRRCPACRAEAGRLAELQGRLRQALYRFDCPDPHALGEYALEILDPRQRAQVAAHVIACPHCTAELQTLRTFLAIEPEPPAGLVERLRRVVATLVAPPTAPAYAGLRGSTARGTRRLLLAGLVTRDRGGPETVAGGEATLASGDVSRRERIDDLGNFTFDAVAPGRYRLEVRLADQVLVIEELQVGG